MKRGKRCELIPMQRIELKARTTSETRKLTLVGPPWMPVGETIYLHGRAWTVVKAGITLGVTLPGFGKSALPPKADKQTKRKLKVNPAGVIAFDFTEEVGHPKRKVALPPKADKQTKRKLKVNPNVIAASDLYEAGRKILEERKK